jgi:hypothetical protein
VIAYWRSEPMLPLGCRDELICPMPTLVPVVELARHRGSSIAKKFLRKVYLEVYLEVYAQ